MTKNVTGFIIKNFLTHEIVIVLAFHNIPDNQNTAVTKAFTKFAKSLLIAPNKAENNPQIVQKINIHKI